MINTQEKMGKEISEERLVRLTKVLGDKSPLALIILGEMESGAVSESDLQEKLNGTYREKAFYETLEILQRGQFIIPTVVRDCYHKILGVGYEFTKPTKRDIEKVKLYLKNGK